MIIVTVIIQSVKYFQLDDTYNELIRKQKVKELQIETSKISL